MRLVIQMTPQPTAAAPTNAMQALGIGPKAAPAPKKARLGSGG